MRTRKEKVAPQMHDFSEIVERVRAHIGGREVAGFTIGYCSGAPEKRVRGSDHRDHARTECLTLAEGMTRQEALDLEAQLTARLKDHAKYDKKGVRPTRSAGGGPLAPPETPVHSVYLAWASARGRTRHDENNRALLEAISKSGDPKGRVSWWIDDDPGYLQALSAPGHFVVAIGKQNVHFHLTQCQFARLARPSSNPHPLTGKGRRKYTGESLAALHRAAEENSPRKLAGQKDRWQVCHCLSKDLAPRSGRGARHDGRRTSASYTRGASPSAARAGAC
jgi:hypothetical protein